MSIRLKNHYLSGADSGTIFTGSDGQVIVSWEGLKVLRDAGKNSAAENTAGSPTSASATAPTPTPAATR
jgi:hypothetical protein